MELCLVERSYHPSLDSGELFLAGKKGFTNYWIAEELRRVSDKMLRLSDGHKPSINHLGFNVKLKSAHCPNLIWNSKILFTTFQNFRNIHHPKQQMLRIPIGAKKNAML